MAEGMRRIVVDGQPFRWRFDDVLVVIPGDRSRPQMYVDWGWRDHLEAEGPGAEPQVVTPRFVAEAIRFAVAHGWPSVTSGHPLRLGFQADGFTLSAKRGEPTVAPDCGGITHT
jgi:hypothetical protein